MSTTESLEEAMAVPDAATLMHITQPVQQQHRQVPGGATEIGSPSKGLPPRPRSLTAALQPTQQPTAPTLLSVLQIRRTARCVASMLTVAQQMPLHMTSRAHRAAAGKSKMLQHAVRCYGVESGKRFAFWWSASGASQLCKNSPTDGEFDESEVLEFCRGSAVQPTGVTGEIFRDVSRTFPRHELFGAEAIGQSVLFDVLKAFARHHSDVGYCQGMNFVAAALISMHAAWSHAAPKTVADGTAHDVYWLLVTLSSKFGCGQLWRPGLPKLRLLGFQLQQLLKQRLPDLHAHFMQIHLSCDVLAAQWLIPLLSSTLPFQSVARVWELFFLEGWKVLFRVCLALFSSLRPRLLEMDLSDVTVFFRSWKDQCDAVSTTGMVDPVGSSDTKPEDTLRRSSFSVRGDDDGFWVIANPELLMQAAMQHKVTNKMLLKLESEYAVLVLREKVQPAPDTPTMNALSFRNCPLLPPSNLDLSSAGRGKDDEDADAGRGSPEDLDGLASPSDTMTPDPSLAGLSFEQKLAALRTELEQLELPAATDAAVLVSKIDNFCRVLPKVYQECATAAEALRSSALELEEQLEHKRNLKAQLGFLTLPPPLATQAAGLQSASQVPMSPPIRVSVDPVIIETFSKKLRIVDDRIKEAAAEWKGRVWQHTLAATSLEEKLNAKQAISDQLMMLLSQVERAKERRMLRLWYSITEQDMRALENGWQAP